MSGPGVRERDGRAAAAPWGGIREDVRYALRSMRRRPGYSAAVLLTLALGIGTFTAVLTVVNAVLLEPLRFPGSDRVMLVWSSSEENPSTWLSYPEFVELREADVGFQSMAALRDLRYQVSGDGEPVELDALAVSADLFPMLRVAPLLGRGFLPEDDQPGAAPVALLSHALWQSRYGADPDVIDRSIDLSGTLHTVVGVLPAGFRLLPPSSVFPERADVWVPLEGSLTAPFHRLRDVRFLHVMGRLRDGAAPERAQAALQAAAAGFRETHPESYGEAWGLRTVQYREHVAEPVRPALLVLSIAVTLLLLVVCANLTSLVLARNTSRSGELATRLAVGAAPVRLARQLFTEALVLAAFGGVLGLALAVIGVRLLRVLGAARVPRLDEVGLDARIFVLAMTATFVAALLFGLLPALRSAHHSAAAVRGAAAGGGGSRGDGRVRRSLVVGQVALAMALLVATALMGKSLLRLYDVPLGFDPDGVVSARASLSPHRFGTPDARVGVIEEWVASVAAQPGVRVAGAVTQLPLSGAVLGSTFELDEGLVPGDTAFGADLRGVTPGYFPAMGITLMEGRGFTADDRAGAPAVAVVDQTLAERYWPGESAVGKRIRWTRSGAWLDVVGVVAPVRHVAVAELPEPTVYRPYAQYATIASLYLAIRGSGDAGAMADAARRELERLAPDHALADVRTMEGRVADSTAPMRFHLTLLALFAGVALVLAAVGIFGVVAYSVSARTHEIALRMAVGAQPRSLVWLVGRQSLALAALGIGLGLVASWMLARWLESVLFGVRPDDLAVYATVPLLILAAAAAAALVPALRTVRIEPRSALQGE